MVIRNIQRGDPASLRVQSDSEHAKIQASRWTSRWKQDHKSPSSLCWDRSWWKKHTTWREKEARRPETSAVFLNACLVLWFLQCRLHRGVHNTHRPHDLFSALLASRTISRLHHVCTFCSSNLRQRICHQLFCERLVCQSLRFDPPIQIALAVAFRLGALCDCCGLAQGSWSIDVLQYTAHSQREHTTRACAVLPIPTGPHLVANRRPGRKVVGVSQQDLESTNVHLGAPSNCHQN